MRNTAQISWPVTWHSAERTDTPIQLRCRGFISQITKRQIYDRRAPAADIPKDMGLPNRRAKIRTLAADTVAAHPGDMQKAAMTAIFAKPGLIPGSGTNLGSRDSA